MLWDTSSSMREASSNKLYVTSNTGRDTNELLPMTNSVSHGQFYTSPRWKICEEVE